VIAIIILAQSISIIFPMKATWYDRQGKAPEVIQYGDLPTPEPAANEVLVQIHASAVNPSDTKKRSGWGGMGMGFDRVIPHQDGSGIITQVGANVSANRLGERVWLYEGQLRRAWGTAAEYMAIDQAQAIPLPEVISFEAGACLGVPALTAHQAVFGGQNVGKDQVVLVTGGAGAVGNYAIQWAKWSGSTVITTVSRPEQAEIAKLAGADHIVNYKQEDVVARVKEITGRDRGVDRIVDVNFAANVAINNELLRNNGSIAFYAAEPQDLPGIPIRSWIDRNITLQAILVYTMPPAAKAAAIKDLATVLESGIFRHNIDRRFPLSEVAAAHEFQESGQAIGKIIVSVIP
jgi:NADPH:quinone reductase